MPSFNTKRIFDFPEVTTATSSHKILIENSAGLAGYINPVNLVSSVIASTTVPLGSIQTIGAATLLGSVSGGAPAALNVTTVKSILNYQFDNIGGQLNVNNNMVVNSAALFNRNIGTNSFNGSWGDDVTAEIRANGTLSTINTPKLGFHRPGESAASIGFYGIDSYGPIFTVKDHSGNSKRIAYVENNMGIYPYIHTVILKNYTNDDYLRVFLDETQSYTGNGTWANSIGSGRTYAFGCNLPDATFRFLRSTGGSVYGGPNFNAYPKSFTFWVTNDGGGPNYSLFNSGGYLEVEFAIAPNVFRRMRWNGNGVNWQWSGNIINSRYYTTISANMAAAGSTSPLILRAYDNDWVTAIGPSCSQVFSDTTTQSGLWPTA